MSHAGPTFNAMLDSSSRQLEPEVSEYSSSSFFEDYDEEDELDYEMDPDSDDDFDETTLWEIASMLKTTDLPSKNSLLPPMPSSQEIIDDYDDDETSSETDFSSETEDYEEFNNEYYEGYSNEARESIVVFSQENDLNPHGDDVADMVEPLATFDEDSFHEIFELPDDSSRSFVRKSPLWSSTRSLVTKESQYGLAQPTSDVWRSYIPSSQDTIRTKPRPSLLLPKLASHDLWSEQGIHHQEEFDSVTGEYFEPESLPITVKALTWTPIAIPVEVPSFGLFSVEARRQNPRSTTEMPAAIDLKKVPRPISSALPVLSSKKLWSLEEFAPRMSKNWMLINMGKPASSSSSTNHFFMWKPSPVVAEVAIQGLFQPFLSRLKYRTTELEPAALILASKARSAPGSLSRLVSNKLWRRPCLTDLSRDHDWISESSIRPGSPSISSETSSGRSSPDISDASSITSTNTKASSLDSLGPASVQRTLSGKKKAEFIPPTPPPADPSKYLSKLSVRQASLEPTPKTLPKASLLIPTRQSKVLASRDIFEVKIPTGSENPQLPRFRRSVVPMKLVKPAHRAIRHQHRPTIAFRANWEDALNEAIIAGLSRSKTTAADWDLSLTKAVTLGRPHVERPQVSQELWKSSLADVIRNGSISAGPTYSEVYNPAILHPVFFTETLVSDVDNIHPAAIGHTKLLRLTASLEDWDRALGKAISKSVPRVQRPTAFLFMWKDALKEATAAGAPKTEVDTSSVVEIQHSVMSVATNIDPSYDVASLHPVFFTKSMISSASDIHPAASGYVKDPRFDSSVLHPVFFTKVLVSTAADIHPACFGHTVVASSRSLPEPSLWIPKSMRMQKTLTGGTWRRPLAQAREPKALFGELASDSIRRVTIRQPMELPTLVSHKLWQSSPVSFGFSRNWLHRSKKSSASRNFLFQKHNGSSIITSQNDALMWEPFPVLVKPLPDMFANMKHEHLKRPSTTRSSPLPCLESTKLYTTSEKSKSEIHWLSVSIATPIVVAKDLLVMWTANGSSAPDLFSSITHEPVKRVPVTRASVLPLLESTKLFTLKDKSKVEIDWLRASVAPMIATPKETMMWVPSLVPTISTPDLFAEVKTSHVKKPSAVHRAALPRLSSTNLFQVESHQKTDIDWLRVSVAEPIAKSTVIEVPAVREPTFEESMADVEALTKDQIAEMLGTEDSIPKKDTVEKSITPEPLLEKMWSASLKTATEDTTGTWTLPRLATSARPDLFVKIKEPYTQKSSNHSRIDLPKLESSELFLPSLTSMVEINWLHTSSSPASTLTLVLTPKFTDTIINPARSSAHISPKTWMPKPSPIAQVSVGGMWISPMARTDIEVSMFSNICTQPLIRKNRQELEKEIESTKLWTKEKNTIESPKHWLFG